MNNHKRMSVGRKILLIAASYSLPITVLVGLMVSTINSYITFGTLELAGNSYQASLEQLLDGVQSHWLERIADPARNGGTTPAKLAVDRALDELDLSQASYGSTLQFTEEGLGKRGRGHLNPRMIRMEWNRAATATSDLPGQYEHLVADIRGMITHSGDTSNLILDPDLDSYYLMDVTLLALPQMQDRLARVIASEYGILSAGGPLTDAQRVKMAVERTQLEESDIDRIAASSLSALTEDANFYGVSPTLRDRIRPSAEIWHSASVNFVAMLEEQAASTAVAVDAEDFLAAGEQARRASFDYWNVTVAELNALIHTRVASYKSDRTMALTWAALATVGAALLSFFLMCSITRPLDEIVQSLGPGATLLAASVERIAESSKDPSAGPEETGIICEELNAHAEKMRHVVLELARHVQGEDAESRLKAATGEEVSA